MSRFSAHLRIKFWNIFVPILFTIVFVVVYCHGFRWLFDYNLNWFSLEHYLWDFFVPLAFSIALPYLLLKRRIRLLQDKGNTKRMAIVLFYVTAIVCFVIVLNTQKNVERLAFETIKIRTVTYVDTYPNDRFFDILDPSINRQEEVFSYQARVKGKNNNNFVITMYLAYPFIQGERRYWFGLSKRETISNRWSNNRKQVAIAELKNRFYTETSERRFDVDYGFRRLMHSDDREEFVKAIQRATNLTEEQYENLVILLPEDIEAMEENELSQAVFWTFGIGSLVMLLMVLFSKLNTNSMNDFKQPAVYFKETKSWSKSILWSFKALPITTSLVGINILVFIVGVLQGVHFLYPSGEELYYYGAATQESLLSEKYWQILSSFFVHAGLMHMLYNMAALYCVGAILEQKLKSFLFVIMYLLSGIFAVLVTLYLGDNVILVGASGAVFGLLGILLAFLLFNVFKRKSRSIVLFCLIFFGGISLVIGFFTPNVANIAHLSGLAFGFTFGSFYALVAKLR